MKVDVHSRDLSVLGTQDEDLTNARAASLLGSKRDAKKGARSLHLSEPHIETQSCAIKMAKT